MTYEMVVVTNMAIAILFAMSLNIITGLCGQVSLGHAAFLGIGAYTSALLTKAGLPLTLSLLPAAILAGAVGLVVGMAFLEHPMDEPQRIDQRQAFGDGAGTRP